MAKLCTSFGSAIKSIDLLLPLELFAARGLKDQRQVTHSAIADVYDLFIVRQAGKYSAWMSHCSNYSLQRVFE